MQHIRPWRNYQLLASTTLAYPALLLASFWVFTFKYYFHADANRLTNKQTNVETCKHTYVWVHKNSHVWHANNVDMQHADFVLIYDFIFHFFFSVCKNIQMRICMYMSVCMYVCVCVSACENVIFVIACQNLKCFDIFCDIVAMALTSWRRWSWQTTRKHTHPHAFRNAHSWCWWHCRLAYDLRIRFYLHL